MKAMKDIKATKAMRVGIDPCVNWYRQLSCSFCELVLIKRVKKETKQKTVRPSLLAAPSPLRPTKTSLAPSTQPVAASLDSKVNNSKGKLFQVIQKMQMNTGPTTEHSMYYHFQLYYTNSQM